MSQSWMHALNLYLYSVNLGCYEKAHEFPNFFNRTIVGDRNSTVEFENKFQENAPNNIAAYFEVIFWKLYSQANYRQKQTSRVVEFVQMNGIKPKQLWIAVNQFVESQNIKNFKVIRELLGFKTDVLAVALTLPALANPETIPMIDQQVAKWVNQNAANHNINRKHRLTLFNMNYTSLRQNDFSNYLNWVAWCQEVAEVLSELTKMGWRARDVEMAVFTAQRNRMKLNVLP